MIKNNVGESIHRGISSFWYYNLKWFAIIIMIIDHVAHGLSDELNMSDELVTKLRIIGRLAYPLFAYLLVENFHYTKNRSRHIKRIILLAIVSEIPFDYMTNTQFLNLTYQNTCFTLASGYLALYIINGDFEFLFKQMKKEKSRKKSAQALKFDILFIIIIATALANFDYGGEGIVLIAMFEFSRTRKHYKLWQFVSMCVFVVLTANLIYVFAFLDLILIYLAEKNVKPEHQTILGKKISKKLSRIYTKKSITIFGSIFYPLHLIIISYVKVILMVNNYFA